MRNRSITKLFMSGKITVISNCVNRKAPSVTDTTACVGWFPPGSPTGVTSVSGGGGYAYGQFAALVTYKYSTFGPPGGGSKSLRVLQHKTVGPSRVKKREFAGPPVSRDPDGN